MNELKNLKKVKSFDIADFDGMKSKIGQVELTKVEEKDFGSGLVKVQQIIISSENLQTSGKEIIAREYIPLKFDDELKEFGIPENPNSSAMKILNYFKVKDFSELEGKECMIVKRVKKDKEFLGIHFG